MELALATGEGGACLLLILLVARETAMAEQGLGLTEPLSATRLGAGRLATHALLGPALVSQVVFLACVVFLYVLYTNHHGLTAIHLYDTLFYRWVALVAEVLCLGAWVGVFVAALSGAPAVLASIALFALSRLALPPPLGGLLPVPVSDTTRPIEAASILAEVLSAFGLTLVVLGLRARSREHRF